MKRLIYLILIFIFVLSVLPSCATELKNDLTIDVLDIGKADCIVIKNSVSTIMIDTGEEENLPTIETYLKANGIQKIDCLILSHYDKDHIGGAKKIISTYNVEKVVESSFISDRDEYINYHAAAEKKSISVNKLENDTEFAIGDLAFTISVPKKASYEKKEDNNASLVVAMKYKNISFLFCGDAMNERMDEILIEDPGKFDLVKLPHHGSYLKRYDEILESLSCRNVVITDSEKNPADEKLLTLLDHNKIACYETRYGTVSITCDGQTLSIKQ